MTCPIYPVCLASAMITIHAFFLKHMEEKSTPDEIAPPPPAWYAVVRAMFVIHSLHTSDHYVWSVMALLTISDVFERVTRSEWPRKISAKLGQMLFVLVATEEIGERDIYLVLFAAAVITTELQNVNVSEAVLFFGLLLRLLAHFAFGNVQHMWIFQVFGLILVRAFVQEDKNVKYLFNVAYLYLMATNL